MTILFILSNLPGSSCPLPLQAAAQGRAERKAPTALAMYFSTMLFETRKVAAISS